MCLWEESTDEHRQPQRQVEISNRSRQTVMGLQTGQGIHGKVCYVKSTWPGCEVKQVGALSLSQYHFPWTDVVIANDRWILCGGIPPPMTARGNRIGTVIERKPTPGQPRPRTLMTSARRTTVYKTTARVWTNRENCKGPLALNAPSYPTASQTNQCPRDCISTGQVQSFFFSGGPVTISKATE